MGNRPVMIISACLVGRATRYDGRRIPVAENRILGWIRSGRALAICPEIVGGLTVPRSPAEILGGDGARVWQGQSRVRTQDGHDVTAAFLRGARRVARLIDRHDIRIGIFKDGSPSCGVNRIYDGTFQGRSRPGHGVTVAPLMGLGVRVFSEDEVADALRFAATMGGGACQKLTGSGNFGILF